MTESGQDVATNCIKRRTVSEGLVRAIGRWSLAALMVNCIIGSGVFGLPSVLAGLLGRASVLAVILAAAAMGVIMACFAEVASRFAQTGGPYLYAREAFGRFMGIQVAWLVWFVRLTACAANANLFVDLPRGILAAGDPAGSEAGDSDVCSSEFWRPSIFVACGRHAHQQLLHRRQAGVASDWSPLPEHFT